MKNGIFFWQVGGTVIERLDLPYKSKLNEVNLKVVYTSIWKINFVKKVNSEKIAVCDDDLNIQIFLDLKAKL